MLDLTRCVRFCLNPALPPMRAVATPRNNTFAAWPSMVGLGVFYELEVRCRGSADAITGYMVNISAIDDAVRRVVIPIIDDAMRSDPLCLPAALLPRIIESLAPELDGLLSSVRWRLTPYHSVMMDRSMRSHVTLAQQFEFAAAHRLHSEKLTLEENRATFGRCNNPNTHGHNYRLEVAVEAPFAAPQGTFELADLERIVNERVIQRFDHTNLNADVPEFDKVNPSVENIAKVCHNLIRQQIAEAGARLAHVTVWETDKTSATYRV